VTAVTKLRASVALPGGPYTLPDYAWGAGGTALFGGDNSLVCGAGTHVTVPNAMVLSGSRLAIVGQDDIIGTITPLRGPMLAMVRVSDGALIEFHDYLALRGDGSVWGNLPLTTLWQQRETGSPQPARLTMRKAPAANCSARRALLRIASSPATLNNQQGLDKYCSSL
jgi:hypothetical protein